MTTSLRTNEQGLVSIVVVSVLMIIITLITLNFAQIIRREQRQALDRQLQTQAFYAAESGINAARNAVASVPTAIALPDKDKCTNDTYAGTAYANLDGKVDDGNSISYSCLLVNPTPPDLQYSLDPTGGSKTFPIDGGVNINSLKFEWTGSSTAGCPSTQTSPATFAQTTNYTCGFGVLRLDLIPIPASFSRESLAQTTFSAVLAPTTGTGSPSADYAIGGGATNIYGGPSRQGYTGSALCSGQKCSFTITNLPAATKFYAKVSTVYKGTTVTITGNTGVTNVQFRGAQILVDSTGKAQDVLRRVQVRIPQTNSPNAYPDTGVQVKNSICKQFTTFDSNGSNGTDTSCD